MGSPFDQVTRDFGRLADAPLGWGGEVVFVAGVDGRAVVEEERGDGNRGGAMQGRACVNAFGVHECWIGGEEGGELVELSRGGGVVDGLVGMGRHRLKCRAREVEFAGAARLRSPDAGRERNWKELSRASGFAEVDAGASGAGGARADRTGHACGGLGLAGKARAEDQPGEFSGLVWLAVLRRRRLQSRSVSGRGQR